MRLIARKFLIGFCFFVLCGLGSVVIFWFSLPADPINPPGPRMVNETRQPFHTTSGPPHYKAIDVETLTDSQLHLVLADRRYTPTNRNNAANRLLKNGDPTLPSRLIQMLKDDSESNKWRNYCIQFLRECHAEGPQSKILETLFEACKHKSPEISSCAIWSLALLGNPTSRDSVLSTEDIRRIATIAKSALRDADAHFLVRTGGAQACARLNVTEALPILKKLAQSENVAFSLRIVSIASLGQLKDEGSRDILSDLSRSQNSRIRRAASVALDSLSLPP